MEIVVVGKSEFTLGFRLTGIRKIIDTEDEDDLASIIRNVLEERNIGVMIMHNDDFAGLPEPLRILLDETVTPTTITLGGSAESSNLRDKIKQAVGVDLWK